MGTPSRIPSGRLPALVLALSLAYVALLGIASRDFGTHWDEASVTRSVQKSFSTGLMLPGWYNYPSLTYDLALVVALPHAVADAAQRWDLQNRGPGSPALVGFLGSPGYLLEIRSLFFLLSALTGLAVYLLAFRLTGHAWAALFGALVSVTAWEFTYHARWVAPDCLVMVLAAFSLWSQQRLLDPGAAPRRRTWLALAAMFTGLATGAKYPGAILVLPLLTAVALSARERRDKLREAGLALLVVFATFALTSPGCFLEPMVCLREVRGEMIHYQYGHGGHTVAAGWMHFSLLATYLGIVLLSRNSVLAALGMALALAGAVDLLRTDRRTAAWLLPMPALFVAYTCMQRVMLVRNDLLLLPVLALLAARGLAWLLRGAGARAPLRYALAGAAALLIAFNLGVATSSAWSIVSPNKVTQKQALERRLAAAPQVKFCLSPGCQALLAESPPFRATNVVDSLPAADRFVFVSNEVKDWTMFAANKLGRYRTVWKRVDEVNWDYYPDWSGSPRMLEVSARDLAATE